MVVIILIIVVVFVLCVFNSPTKSNDIKPVQPVQSEATVMPVQRAQGKAISTNWIKEFFHGYVSLSKKHKIYDCGIILSWSQGDLGYDLVAELTVYKIDEEDAAEAVKMLRNAIAMAKKTAKERIALDGGDSTGTIMQGYNISNQMILGFYGTDHLQGDFWDIDDCEFVDGKYLRFTTEKLVPRGESVQENLQEIEKVAKEFGLTLDRSAIGNSIVRIR